MPTDQTSTEAATGPTGETVRVVASHTLHVPVADVRVTPLAGDASVRTFFRVCCDDRSVVAVCYPAPFSVGDGAAGRYERWCRERPVDGPLTFANDPLCHLEVTALLEQKGVPVPEVVAVADRAGMIFVEDAGDLLVQYFAGGPTAVLSVYERAVDIIAAIRSATHEALATGSVAGKIALNADKLVWELEFWRRNCFGAYLGSPLDGEFDLEVQEECLVLAESLAARPRVLCHRDYHARNLLLRSDREPVDALVVIDFQDARMGPLSYDLVSLLEDPYATLEDDTRLRLRERFADSARLDGSWPGRHAFAEEYDLATLQRLLKAIGTYSHQAAARGRGDYAPYISPAATGARNAAERLGRYPALLRAINVIEAAAARN